jgi:hypothetical protein
MTFLELKTEAANRLNLSSSDSLTRLGSLINQRYRRLTSSLGLSMARRATASVNTVSGTDTITFTSLEKLELVYIIAAGKKRVLGEIPYEEYVVRNVEQAKSGTPDEYAVKSITASTVTIALYPTPDAVVAIKADGLANATTLTDADVPNIPADFHDALILGAMSDELFKMEKYQLAKDFQSQYEQRASDLRLSLAKSAYLSLAEADVPGGLITVVRKRWQA